MIRFTLFRGLLPLCLLLGAAGLSPGQQKAPNPVPQAPVETVSATGKWRWMDNQVVIISADFTFSAGKGRSGTWKLKEGTSRTYLLTWDEGLFVDELTLSQNGKKLSGRNNKKKKIEAERIE